MLAKKRGFTLIELLVVISIIALLVSILLPSLQKARESANKVVCGSNQKQIVLAMVTWAMDHNGDYPHSPYVNVDGVDGQLLRAKYLELPELFQCKSDRDYGPLGYYVVINDEPVNERTVENKRSYSFNISPWGWSNTNNIANYGAVGFKSARQTDRWASERILMSEVFARGNLLYHTYFHGYYGPGPSYELTGVSGYTKYPGKALYAYTPSETFAHGQGCNFGFADGHAEFINVEMEDGDYPTFYMFHGGYYQPGTWPW